MNNKGRQNIGRNANSERLSAVDMFNIYMGRLTEKAYEADVTPEKIKAKKLIDLLSEEEEILERLRGKGVTPGQRREYIENSPKQREIRSLLIYLGIAEMMVQGDYRVNRTSEVPVGMGVIDLPEIETGLIRFQKKYGLTSERAPDRENKFIHLDLGCGNMSAGFTRRKSTIKPFGDEGAKLSDYIEQVGFADRIYFTLEDLLKDLVSSEHKEDPAIIELVKVLLIILNRKIYFGKQFTRKPGKELGILLDMTTNLNLLREVLGNPVKYISNFDEIVQVGTDVEFLNDDRLNLSGDTIVLIKEYAKDPDRFLEKYFARVLSSSSGQEERRYNKLLRDIRDYDKKIMSLNTQIAESDEEQAKELERKRSGYLAHQQNIVEQAGKYRKDELFDLSRRVTIHPHNVVLGDFSELAEIFPEKDSFLMVSSYRAISHAEDDLYTSTVLEASRRLIPGGVFLEDGRRESYTRYDRIEDLKVLKGTLGDEYRVTIIVDEYKGLKTTVIERAITLEGGGQVFFSDENDIRRNLKSKIYSPEDAASMHPEYIIRNMIIAKVRNLFIDDPLKDVTEASERRRMVFSQRLKFIDLHQRIDIFLAEALSMQKESLDEKVCIKIVEEVYERLKSEVESVRSQVKALLDEAIIMRRGYFPVLFVPNADPELKQSPLNKPQSLSIRGIPRNSKAPNLDNSPELVEMQNKLIANLRTLRELTGTAPIKLFEFGSYTAPMMRRALDIILDGEEDLLEIRRVNLMRNRPIKTDDENAIYLLGGSSVCSDDDHNNLISTMAVPLVQRIEDGENIAAFGVCFGSQILLEALGEVKGFEVSTQEGALEFGPTAVFFDESLPLIGDSEMPGGGTVAMTHSRYSVIPNYQQHGVKALARYDKKEAPPACESNNGRIITCQFHPEVELSRAGDRRILSRYIQRSHEKLKRKFFIPKTGKKSNSSNVWTQRSASPHTLINHNIDIEAVNKRGETEPWVKREIGMAFLIPQLLKQTELLLDGLSKSS